MSTQQPMRSAISAQSITYRKTLSRQRRLNPVIACSSASGLGERLSLCSNVASTGRPPVSRASWCATR